jgi:hypothetical protein
MPQPLPSKPSKSVGAFIPSAAVIASAKESAGVGGELFKVSPCRAGAKLTPQAEAIGNRGEEREGQGQPK